VIGKQTSTSHSRTKQAIFPLLYSVIHCRQSAMHPLKALGVQDSVASPQDSRYPFWRACQIEALKDLLIRSSRRTQMPMEVGSKIARIHRVVKYHNPSVQSQRQ
jgi:hypothetical protein